MEDLLKHTPPFCSLFECEESLQAALTFVRTSQQELKRYPLCLKHKSFFSYIISAIKRRQNDSNSKLLRQYTTLMKQFVDRRIALDGLPSQSITDDSEAHVDFVDLMCVITFLCSVLML